MELELQKILGETAREARERLGLTQAQVASQVGLVPGVYGRVERGDMMPSVPSLRRICLVLGISSDTLLDLRSPHEAGRGPRDGSDPRVPELRRVLHQLEKCSPKRLRVLSQVLQLIAAADED